MERTERLREAVRAAGGNQAVARRAGIPVGTLNNYLAGRDMKASAMIAVAGACSVSIEWLAAGRGPMRAGDQAPATPQPVPPAVPELFTTLDMDVLAEAIRVAILLFPRRTLTDTPWRNVARATALKYNDLAEEKAAKEAERSAISATVNAKPHS
jgi:AcrR family transcriptional regulator